MRDEGADEPERRGQSFRNRVTFLIVAVIVGTLAILYYFALGSGTGRGIAGALCTVAFLAVAFLGWEYLMKPGYGLRARLRDSQTEGTENQPPGGKRSP